MRSTLTLLATAALLWISCDRIPGNPNHRRPDDPDEVSRVDEDDTPSSRRDSTVYTLGIEYPDSYDWQRDTAYGNVSCKLVVFANQRRILEVDAGPGTGLSADPDMHRIWDGHLYSDSSNGSHTVISKDGKEIFRYEGNEMVTGFMVLDGNVHTLGQSRSGKGFSYRIDGELILSDPEGVPVGDPYSTPVETGTMYLDQGKVCFGFRKGESGGHSWYAVRDGKAEAVDCGVRLTDIFDIRYIEGRLHVCGTSETYGGRAVHVCEGKITQLWKDPVKATSFCHIVPSGDRIYLYEGHIRKDGKTETSLWRSEGLVVIYGTDYAGVWMSEGQYAYLTMNDKGFLGTVRAGDGYWWFQDQLMLMSHQCVRYDEGALLIAATPVRKDLSPVLWKNGKSLALTLHGYLAGIWISHLEETDGPED